MSDESNTDSKENKADRENAQISNAYQAMQKPAPSESLDAAILATAKSQADKSKNLSGNSSLSQQAKRKWLTYQYSGSIAASIFLVAVLVIMLEPEYANNTDILSDNGLVSDIKPSMSNAPEQLTGLSQADAVSLRDDVQKEQPSNTDISIADLYKRLSELNRFNQDDSATTNSSKAKSKMLVQSPRESIDIEEYAKLQQTLFTALNAQKQEQQNWQLDEKYKIVLSNKQIEILESHKGQ